MAAPAEPAAYRARSYGGFSVNSSSCSSICNMLPCRMDHTSASPPSPSSSLSLEALSSSPSSSQPAQLTSYAHLLSSSYTYIPTLLDTPCSPLSQPPFPLKRRPLEAPSPGALMVSKRICESGVGSDDSNIAHRSREVIPSFVDNALLSNHGDHSNELLAEGACDDRDLDDVLDLLLQEAEVAPALTAQLSLSFGHESSLLAHHLKEEGKEVLCKLDHCKVEEIEEMYSCKPSNDSLVSSWLRSPRAWSNASRDLIEGKRSTGDGSGAGGIAAGTDAAVQELQTNAEPANTLSFCEELLKQMAPKCTAIAKQEQNDQTQEEGMRLQEAQINRKTQTKQHMGRPLGAGSKWAGPTLLDIESALAMASPPSSTCNMYPSSLSSPLHTPPPLASSFLSSIRDILNRDPTSYYLSCKEQPTQDDDDKLSTWRRLQKRNQMEPRYTVKIRCEEDAVNDGYRWRKYGQKSIKNSPYPRSYYRCSSGKCNVKKQVERSGDDAGLLLVSYEGIHLHHRPTSLHTCVAAPTTCDRSFPNAHPHSPQH